MNRNDRLAPCVCCKFPLTQEHHLLQRKDWGDNTATIRLCATCHEVFHLLYRCYIDKSKPSMMLAGKLMLKVGLADQRTTFLYNLVQDARRLEKETSRKLFEEIENLRGEI